MTQKLTLLGNVCFLSYYVLLIFREVVTLVTVVSCSLDIVNLVFTQRNRSAFIEFTFAALHHAMPCTRVAASSIVRHHISMHQVTCGSLQYCCKHSILPPLGIKVNEGLRQIQSSNMLILC